MNTSGMLIARIKVSWLTALMPERLFAPLITTLSPALYDS